MGQANPRDLPASLAVVVTVLVRGGWHDNPTALGVHQVAGLVKAKSSPAMGMRTRAPTRALRRSRRAPIPPKSKTTAKADSTKDPVFGKRCAASSFVERIIGRPVRRW